jgi:SAM-dependent methyltransferase
VSSLSDFNESAYVHENAYQESPHLKHPTIHNRLLGLLRDAIDDVNARGLPPTLLDIGAGTGAFAEPALNAGCAVTATDMAATAIKKLVERCGGNRAFCGVHDPMGDLAGVGRFSIILYASVLHHIPDYEAAVRNALTHLVPGGALLTFQDPMWYPSMSSMGRHGHTAAYLAWRATRRRDLVNGIRSRTRRWLKGPDASRAADVIEFHVLRNGVNQHEMASWLGSTFEHLAVCEYWSTPSRTLQRLGETLGAKSDFAISGFGKI